MKIAKRKGIPNQHAIKWRFENHRQRPKVYQKERVTAHCSLARPNQEQKA
jgi:hypothetical protein